MRAARALRPDGDGAGPAGSPPEDEEAAGDALSTLSTLSARVLSSAPLDSAAAAGTSGAGGGQESPADGGAPILGRSQNPGGVGGATLVAGKLSPVQLLPPRPPSKARGGTPSPMLQRRSTSPLLVSPILRRGSGSPPLSPAHASSMWDPASGGRPVSGIDELDGERPALKRREPTREPPAAPLGDDGDGGSDGLASVRRTVAGRRHSLSADERAREIFQLSTAVSGCPVETRAPSLMTN